MLAAGEAMNHALRPYTTKIGQLENYAATALTRSTATCHRGAIEIALSIKSDAFVGFATVGATGKVVEHGVSPGRCRGRELKNCPTAESSAKHRRTVNIARAIGNQISVGVLAIGASSEAIEHLYWVRGPTGTDQHRDCPADG